MDRLARSGGNAFMTKVFEKCSDFDQPLFWRKCSIRRRNGQDLEFKRGKEKTDGSEVIQGAICIYNYMETRFR